MGADKDGGMLLLSLLRLRSGMVERIGVLSSVVRRLDLDVVESDEYVNNVRQLARVRY